MSTNDIHKESVVIVDQDQLYRNQHPTEKGLLDPKMVI